MNCIVKNNIPLLQSCSAWTKSPWRMKMNRECKINIFPFTYQQSSRAVPIICSALVRKAVKSTDHRDGTLENINYRSKKANNSLSFFFFFFLIYSYQYEEALRSIFVSIRNSWKKIHNFCEKGQSHLCLEGRERPLALWHQDVKGVANLMISLKYYHTKRCWIYISMRLERKKL